MVEKYIVLFCSIVILGGCAQLREHAGGDEECIEPLTFPAFSCNYLLSCLNDTQNLDSEEFGFKFELAEAELKHGRKLDKLHFICLSLHEKADYKQFQQGADVLERYLEDYHDAGEDMLGLRILVQRIDEEIMNRWSAWKSLLNDKKELMAEVDSLKVRVEEQQKQIERLKNIENIIKSREIDRP
ncbi:MAG: hypothetical protein M8357_00125 [Desulfobulbaceae bacterium]|nr:hypothetical protein [Desulfobulbaceae bacterium]